MVKYLGQWTMDCARDQLFVSGSSWFSPLDLQCGCYQVALTAESSPKTDFFTRQGLW